MHLDHFVPVIHAPAMLEVPSRRPLHLVQRGLDFGDRILMQMIELQEDGALAGLELAVKLHHHLAGPIIALDKSCALIVYGIRAEGACNASAGWAAIILDQQGDLKT